MARINIEESLWGDAKFLTLSQKLGSTTEAIGTYVVALRLARDYWVQLGKPIPKPVFLKTVNSAQLLESGMAEIVDDGEFVYVYRTAEQYDWLRQRSKAGTRPKIKPLRNLSNGMVTEQ